MRASVIGGFAVGVGTMAAAFLAAPAAGRALEAHGIGPAPALAAGAFPLGLGLGLMFVGRNATATFLAGASAGAAAGLIAIPAALLGTYALTHWPHDDARH